MKVSVFYFTSLWCQLKYPQLTSVGIYQWLYLPAYFTNIFSLALSGEKGIVMSLRCELTPLKLKLYGTWKQLSVLRCKMGFILSCSWLWGTHFPCSDMLMNKWMNDTIASSLEPGNKYHISFWYTKWSNCFMRGILCILSCNSFISFWDVLTSFQKFQNFKQNFSIITNMFS